MTVELNFQKTKCWPVHVPSTVATLADDALRRERERERGRERASERERERWRERERTGGRQGKREIFFTSSIYPPRRPHSPMMPFEVE